MSSLDPLLDSGAAALAAAVNRGEVDLGELGEAIVDRLGRAPRGSLLAVDPDGVVEQLGDLGGRLGDGERPRLAGVPVAHKDLFDTVRFPTTYGNPALGRRPDRDAVAVARTVAEGAIQVAKGNLHEVAFGVTGKNPHTGDTENPVAPDRIPGGSSSGGAAAVAAGAVLASLGTDTGGSIRIPASCCGIVGLKTTRGAVPRTGVLPLSNLQDTVGPLAGSLADAALLLDTIVGPDRGDASTLPPPEAWKVTRAIGTLARDVEGVVVILPRELWEVRVAPEVAAPCRDAVDRLEANGAELRETDLPGFQDARRAQATLLAVHALAVHRDRLSEEPDVFGADVRARLEAARDIEGWQVAEALGVREQWVADVTRALPGKAVIACPTIPMLPPRTDEAVVVWEDGEEDVTPALTRFTGVWNLGGFPALSVPAGRVDGVPVGLQLVGRHWAEPLLLRIAGAVEATAP